jgi:nucleoside phosphorylase/predicted transcriptional regulator
MRNSSLRHKKYDIGIIVPLKDEFEVLTELCPITRADDCDATHYYTLRLPGFDYRAFAVLLGDMGTTLAGQVTEKVLNTVNVGALVLMGIAGALEKSLKLGDVIVADQINEVQAASKVVDKDRSFERLYSGKVWPTDFGIRQCIHSFQFEERELYDAWRSSVKKAQDDLMLSSEQLSLTRDAPKIEIGPIASGNTVSASRAYTNELHRVDRRFKAIETEAAGFAQVALERKTHVRILVVRGISDFADERKKELDLIRDGVWRRYAMYSAATFFVNLIKARSFGKIVGKDSAVFQTPADSLKPRSGPSRTDLREHILSAMLTGLSTPTTMARRVGCTIQYASRFLGRLEQEGLVQLVDKGESYKLTERGRLITLRIYSDNTRDIHQGSGLYDGFDPYIVNVSDGTKKRYLSIRITERPPYLPLFPRFGFDSAALTCLDPSAKPSETKYTLAMTGKGVFDSLDAFSTYLDLLRRHFWASDLSFTIDRSTINELMLGWGASNLATALGKSKDHWTNFGVLLSSTTPHPIIVIGCYERRKGVTFDLLVTSWYVPDSKESEELQRLFALAGSGSTALFFNRIEEGPSGDEFYEWKKSVEGGGDRESQECKIFHYANRSRSIRREEPWYLWIVASNPIISGSLDRYSVHDYVMEHVLDSDVLPLLPMELNMTYRRSELGDALRVRSLRLEYSILHPRPALPEHYGYYGPLIVRTVVEHRIQA